MKLTQLFTREKTAGDAGRSQKSPESGSLLGKNGAGNTMTDRQIRALSPGQTLQGEIVSRSGSEVLVRIAEDMLLSARMEQGMNLEIGKSMVFQIKNNGAVLMLSPLFENMAADENILKALDMAGLPVNETTASMTEQLMKAGLPIDKNTLQQVYRELNSHMDATLVDLLDLHRLGLPVTENNLTQISSYKNLSYRLEAGLDQLLESFSQTFESLLQKGDVKGASRILGELFSMLSQEAAHMGETYGGGNEALIKALRDILANALARSVGEGGIGDFPASEQAAGSRPGIIPEGNPANSENLQGEYAQSQRPTESVGSAGGGIPGENGQNTGAQSGLQAILGNRGEQSALLEHILSGGGFQREQTLKELQNVLSQAFKDFWSLRPEDVAEPGRVNELYDRMDRQLKQLAQVLEEAGQAGTPVHRAAEGIVRNLDFLQQINQMYTYVQLPVRLQQSRAHGDLYVFTNKRNLAESKGQISALLHLDMEHLGPVDVYVAMQGEKVNTRFYVGDEELLDFLEPHMELLTNRIQSRGYDCSFAMQVRETQNQPEDKQESGILPLLKQTGHVPMGHYAFDMRA